MSELKTKFYVANEQGVLVPRNGSRCPGWLEPFRTAKEAEEAAREMSAKHNEKYAVLRLVSLTEVKAVTTPAIGVEDEVVAGDLIKRRL